MRREIQLISRSEDHCFQTKLGVFRNFVELKPVTIGEQVGTPEGKTRRWTIYNPHLLSAHNLHESREAITVDMQ